MLLGPKPKRTKMLLDQGPKEPKSFFRRIDESFPVIPLLIIAAVGFVAIFFAIDMKPETQKEIQHVIYGNVCVEVTKCSFTDQLTCTTMEGHEIIFKDALTVNPGKCPKGRNFDPVTDVIIPAQLGGVL